MASHAFAKCSAVVNEQLQCSRFGLRRFRSDSERPIKSQDASAITAKPAGETQAGSNPEMDATIRPNRVSMIAAPNQAQRTIRRLIPASSGSSGF